MLRQLSHVKFDQYIIQYLEDLQITSIFLSLQVSERAGHIIQYDKFYIHELNDLIDIRNDYVTWIQRQMYPMVSPLLIPRFTSLHLSMLSHSV